MLTRTPTERELLSLRTYAARIRELNMPPSGLQCDAIAELLVWLPPDIPILPRLRRLDWYFDRNCSEMPLHVTTRLLDCGNLRHLSLLLCDPLNLYRSSLLNDFSPFLSGLDSFSLQASNSDMWPAYTRNFLIDEKSLIWRLPRLKSLKVDDKFTVTRPILVSLSELSLQSLTLSNFSTSINAGSPRLHLPTLLNLSLTAAASDVVNIMQSISFPNATNIFLSINDQGPISTQRTTFHAIYSAFPASLRRLHVKVNFRTPGWMPRPSDADWQGPGVLDFDAFVRPLQALRHLQELTLYVEHRDLVHGPLRLDMRNGDLRSLIPSWPELSLFSYNTNICPSFFWRSLQCDDPTLDTIFAFARAHPRLLYICLPGCVRLDPLPDDPPPLEDTTRPLEGHGLLWLKVDSSTSATPKDAADLEPIARAVDRAFPRLYKGIQRNRVLAEYLPVLFLDKELRELHAGEAVCDDDNDVGEATVVFSDVVE